MRKLLLFLLVTLSIHVYGYHIVGGEMYYDYLGNNNYRITMLVYRDCSVVNAADFDDPALIGVFDSTGNLIAIDSIYYVDRDTIPPVPSNPCFTAPGDICTEHASYIFTVNLPPVAGGYDVVYSRCCRNAAVINILNPDQVGTTNTIHIDPLETPGDNCPRFNNYPPVVICADEPLVYDHSAFDPDSTDSLSYSFFTPFVGGTQNNPIPFPSPPPFGNVVWASPYGLTNLVGGTPYMTIDPKTGIINADPNIQGRFIVGVQVQAFHSGVLVTTVRRDFQFVVTPCIIKVEAKIPVISTVDTAATHTSGLYEVACDTFLVNFLNESINANTYHWIFGDTTNPADTSDAFEPSYLYPDTGTYIVTLIANPGLFCADTTSVYLELYPTFKTNFSFMAGCANSPVYFKDLTTTTNGFVNSWAWNFGDGQSTSGNNIPQHSYSSGGTYSVELVSGSNLGCVDSITKQVTVNPVPKGSILNTPACLDQPTVFTTNATILTGSVTSYSWNLGNGSQSSQDTATTIYSSTGMDSVTLIMTSNLGCSDTVGKDLNVQIPPTITVNNDTSVCLQQPVQLTASGGVTYVWYPPTGLSNDSIANPVAYAPDTTQYVAVGADSEGCTGKDSLTIYIDPLPATNAGRDTFVCIGASYQLQGSGGNRFTWSPSKYMNDSAIADPTITPDSSITYILTSYNMYNCVNHDTVNINVEYHITPNISGNEIICYGDTTTATATGGFYYLWTPATGVSNDTASTVKLSPPDVTGYQVKIYNDCYSVSLPWEITVNQLPPVKAEQNDTILRGLNTTLYASGALSYAWNPPGVEDSTGSSLVVSPFNTTTYVVTGTDQYGCKNEDSVTVFVKVENLILLPSAFSPNGDGKDDVFRIVRHLNVQELLEFSVYNRWGEKVFTTNDLNTGWDGTYNGKPQEVGVYVYYVRALNYDGKIIGENGNVTLVR